MTFERRTLPDQPYLYVERECPYGPEIAQAMGSAFEEVFGFARQAGITPAHMPMSVYLHMDPSVLRFRGGVIVSAEDAAKAAGDIRADLLPAGDVMTTVHTGSYDRMGETHKALWAHLESQGLSGAMPVWEIYVDDPADTPADRLRTEIYCRLA